MRFPYLCIHLRCEQFVWPPPLSQMPSSLLCQVDAFSLAPFSGGGHWNPRTAKGNIYAGILSQLLAVSVHAQRHEGKHDGTPVSVNPIPNQQFRRA